MSYEDPVKQREYQRVWRLKRNQEEKVKSFNLLGGICIMCGTDDIRVLQIDHIKAIRRKSKTESFETGIRLRQRIANGSRDLDNLQLLCANCHQIKTYNEFYGTERISTV